MGYMSLHTAVDPTLKEKQCGIVSRPPLLENVKNAGLLMHHAAGEIHLRDAAKSRTWCQLQIRIVIT